ncbi:MAG: mechanosensitive ion channel [Lachnospiraceae bacterium]|nr:mechanosensitive ion channel [Lachnospiraceae bacterium]MDY3817712.1 mechanosensitive ion channel [Lachnospiraceae bacterium]
MINIYLEELFPKLLDLGLSVIGAVLIYLIGGKIVKLVRKLLHRSMNRHHVDDGVIQFLDAVVKMAGYFILILLILGLFGITTASVVAVLGSAGLTLGLALQGSLANFAGGVLILILKPFVVGDEIIEDSHKNRGFVEEISVFYTTIRNDDGMEIVIPNGTLANNSIVNLSKSGKRRVDITVPVSYESDLSQVKTALEAIIAAEPRRLQSECNNVVVGELAESSMNLRMRIWVAPADYWAVRFDTIERVKALMDEKKIDIPFNQLDVHICDESGQ